VVFPMTIAPLETVILVTAAAITQVLTGHTVLVPLGIMIFQEVDLVISVLVRCLFGFSGAEPIYIIMKALPKFPLNINRSLSKEKINTGRPADH